jgi:serine phosphatase RsbU (regulator of sigma subunit)
MLKLSDFVHLPELDDAVAQLMAGGPGLIVVAGLDPRPAAAVHSRNQFLPSGRTAIFRALVGAMLEATPTPRAAVVAEDPAVVRPPRVAGGRFTRLRVQPPQTYADQIDVALGKRPDLLVIDRLCTSSAPAAAAAARQGARVIAQIDSVFRGPATARHLRDLGVPDAQIDCLTWVVFVQRLATLCPHCKRPAAPDPAQLARLRQLGHESAATFSHAPGCDHCHGTGRLGDVAIFDIFRGPADLRSEAPQPSLLPIETYALRLAEQGLLSLGDVLHLDADQLRRTYHLLSAGEQTLAETNTTLERKVAELNAANAVLQQRTAALLSLHDIGEALTASVDLGELVTRVCRYARELCGADRSILYLLREEPQDAEVLAVSGWDRALLHQRIDAGLVAGLVAGRAGAEPKPFRDWPPGIPPRHADVEGAELRAGLRVPLIAEGQQVGLMIVHSTRKARFAPGEIALLRAFANQAAVSIQRAALIERLRDNIAQLEAAQAVLVRQERMEREMELARQVQQSVLPRVFPAVPGYRFAACNQPARQVGGDFYDAFVLDQEHVGIVIADVSDKGMPAALYMALTRSLLFAEARRERSPRLVLLNVNRLLRALGEPDMFVTVFYGVIALRERRLTYARAGHDYPLLLRDGAATPLGGNGIVLGMLDFPDLALDEQQLRLEPGDRLVLYTDGLTDVLDPSGGRFGPERLAELLRSHARLSADELCAATFAELAAYQGAADQFDDMTMLAVELVEETKR